MSMRFDSNNQTFPQTLPPLPVNNWVEESLHKGITYRE
jgi:hypothetical protein